MSTNTTNFDLIKPELSDPADITKLNSNLDVIDQQLAIANKTFDAYLQDHTYEVTVPGVEKLEMGLKFTIVADQPTFEGDTSSYYLNVNGLGAKELVISTDGASIATEVVRRDNVWLQTDYPVEVRYDGYRWVIDMKVARADHLEGVVPFKNGGTGGSKVFEVKENLSFLSVKEYTLNGSFKERTSFDSSLINIPIVLPTDKSRSDIFMFRVDGVSNVSPYTKFNMWGCTVSSESKIEARTWRGDSQMVYGYLALYGNGENDVSVNINGYDLDSKTQVRIYENDGFRITRVVLYFK